MDAIRLSDSLHEQIRSARDTIYPGRELLVSARRRLDAARTAGRARMRARNPEVALLDRLTDPACAAIVADLMSIGEAITDEPDAVARLVMLRVKTDPHLAALLFEVPLNHDEQVIPKQWPRPRLPAGRLACRGSRTVHGAENQRNAG